MTMIIHKLVSFRERNLYPGCSLHVSAAVKQIKNNFAAIYKTQLYSDNDQDNLIKPKTYPALDMAPAKEITRTQT